MDRSRVIFTLIILFAVGIVGAGAGVNLLTSQEDEPASVTSNTTTGSTTSNNNPPPAAGDITLVFQSHNTKERWNDALVQRFNSGDYRTSSQQRIVVEMHHTGSGFQPELQPTAWSPANQLWVDEANQNWLDTQGENLILGECAGTVNIPIGIAMWRPMAEALGWPDEAISWSDITDLATHPDGWASLGHPEWGEFRYGHGHPDHSNSGRLSVVAEIHGSLHSSDPLAVDHVWDETVLRDLQAVQQSIAHYGRIDTDLLDRMVQRGPSYLHAVTNYEGNVIRWNQEKFARLGAPFNQIVLIYPSDGTFWLDYPYCIVDNAPWVTPEEIEAAQIFRDFMLARAQQELLVPLGIRPILADIPLDSPNSPFQLTSGVIATHTPANIPALPYPSDQVMRNIIDMWHTIKKPSTVVMVMDTSGSMFGEPMEAAKAGAAAFIEQMQPQDEIVLITFSDAPLELEAGLVSDVGENLRFRINNLIADGNTALYAATVQAVERINTLRTEDLENGEKRIYGIVLMSDGANTTSDVTQSQMLNVLPAGEDSTEPRLYTIAYGEAADHAELTRMANRTNGLFFEGTVENIGEIYFQISSEF